MLTKKLSVGAISVALFGCGGGNESDPKLTSNETPATGNSGSVLSGVVLDGYLYKANVCLDKNNNAVCDSGDGTTVQTDKSGQYTLPFEGNVENYKLLVEAIANVTVDMDNPNQAVTQGFTLETPSSQPGIISPMTSMVASLATSSGATFDEAAESLASELSVSADVLKSDYAADTSQESRDIHMLARGITRVLQSAQESSVNDGVSQEVARKGSIQRLANLDAAQLKLRTDQLSHGASNTEEALAQIGSDYYEHLKIKPEDLDGDKILTRPRAPRGGVVNDAADTFDWQFVPGFTEVNAYEFSLDRGQSWQPATSKPINVGAPARSVGDVQVRIMAKPARSLASGMALLSTKAFTATLVPAAPTSLTLNDADNSFDWQHSADFRLVAHYEYTLDGGKNWHDVVSKPQNIADIAIPVGDLKLRVKADQSSGRPAGLVVKSETAMTITPDAPVAPVLISANDDSDILAWENVSGFGNAADYEINLGSGWQEASANPYQIGNVNIPANTIQLRVKANPINGRPAGKSLVVSRAFNKVLNKPVAPTLPVINDADNLLNWTNVDGYPNAEQYEYSLDGGISYRPVASNPQAIPDEAFKVGQVCVRIKASADDAVGESLCSDKEFTQTPVTPSAPTAGIVNDAVNTFDWTYVAGFVAPENYEQRISGGNWNAVSTKPIQLEDIAYNVGAIEVRVKNDPVTGRLAGLILSNQTALTKQPDAPIAPTSLIVDDENDTLDWTFVAGFTSVSDYEWSVNSGSDWANVTQKPLVVGDVDKAIDEVKIRVRANSDNGMPAGASVGNPQVFSETVKIAAPANGEILQYNASSGTIYSNSISWDYVTAEVDGSSVRFDKPEHYEFTNDQGASWKTVVAKPQFVGTLAYDKSKVGIRIKADAAEGKTHKSSNVLWASNMTGQFSVLKYVPMVSITKTAGFSTYGGWSSYDTKCVAEYDDQGQGEPVFWAEKQSIDSAGDVLSSIKALTNCGIKDWKLPESTEVATLSARSADTLPTGIRSDLMSDDHSSIWANKSGTIVAYANGAEITPSAYWNYAFPKWSVADGSVLLANVNSEISAIDSYLSTQETELSSAESYFTTWLSDNKGKTKTYSQLNSEATSKHTQLSALLTNWESEKASVNKKLEDLEVQAVVAGLRQDSDSVSFVAKVAQYREKATKLASNNTALSGAIELTNFAGKLALMQLHSDGVSSAQTTMDSASSGSAIHQATLAFYETIALLEQDYESKDGSVTALNSALSAVADSYAGLIALINSMLTEMETVSGSSDIDTLYTAAEGGLNRANSAGYTVLESDALIDGRFAKLDQLGRYLPSATTYSQGWRCVKDTSLGQRNRVWTLLKDGMPGGKDDVVYDASGADLKSAVGSGGYVETANNQQMCGFTDWALPHPSYLESLNTATVSGVSEKTIDVSVFPNHKGFVPEYDESYWQGGTRFFYWTNVAVSSSSQYAYVYANTSESADLSSMYKDGDGNDQYFTLARLVREDAINWQYLTSAGAETSDRVAAQCAKNPDSGEIWQIYQSTTASERYKKYDAVKTELQSFNTQTMCGKSNWVLPTADEYKSRIPNDDGVFAHTFANSSNYSDYDDYVTSGSTDSQLELIEMELGQVKTSYNSSYSSSKYLYRFISK
ncbi:DUF1566 domain-containing protein [Vibrio coralliilyticus]|uniref:DUF1566 domain-containing protein n=1 Tax=Vibrio coralliilyticus TaxID=190893 RepID=UPI001C27CBEA|nr:DUF1566 domain-containing protein [Vibrio coralliilyticus]